ncbi:MAG TPA: TIM barrel protein, partial [Bacillota bacterium]|nr:TIM barrel protein [Bacillota bacterium]
DIRSIAKAAKKQGIRTCYHNHDFEFQKIDGKYALDVLYDSIPADLLQTEIDTCWVNIGGEDPASYVLKYSGRAPILHLKDFYKSGKDNGDLYELIGIEKKEQKKADAFEFRPVGYGMQDFPKIFTAAEQAGTEWIIVEQDEPSMAKTRIECAKMSADYVHSIIKK